MARVTDSEVKAIFDTDITDLSPWIDIAHELTDDVAAEGDVTETRLTLIEKLLTAHFASAEDPRAARETIADVSVTYQGDYSEGISSTSYGQRAIALDPTGTLTAADKASASLHVLDGRNIE